ncbi:MAG: ribonuclease E inhibitor RraB [Actinomycetota bacterium]|nr:ribonuclease E inhibitor RraB [Actinomycetota bacterium]
MTRRLLAAALAAIALSMPGCGGDGNDGGGAQAERVQAAYYVYFARRSDALEAAKELRGDGFETEIREDAGVEWLVIASAELPREQLDAAEGQMRYVAYQFQGDYDGSDIEDD